jgi:SpoVK/Ycf46/Vps4 family AAA+-type ATPase
MAKHVLAPVLDNPQLMPKGIQRGPQYAAGILNGPPGTRKSSFVKTVAGFMEWPLVPVPASVIFDRGFDLMEARASEVFRNLNYLTQCVIFFDEFEEFFRDRKEELPKSRSWRYKIKSSGAVKPPIHDRTIAAFTTSAMLPRLQDLRDEERCLFFLATNHLGKIDDAIIRPGRFDFKETIGHPKTERFGADSESYLICPTERTLKELGIAFDAKKRTVEQGKNGKKGKDELDKIRRAVAAALANKDVTNTLKEYNQKRRKNPGEEEAEANDIPFGFVELAMRSVADKLHGAPEGVKESAAFGEPGDSAVSEDPAGRDASAEPCEGELVKEASAAIIDACNRAMDMKGPPGLPELGNDG